MKSNQLPFQIVQRIKEMHQAGIPKNKIANELGCNKGSVFYYCRKIGTPVRYFNVDQFAKYYKY